MERPWFWLQFFPRRPSVLHQKKRGQGLWEKTQHEAEGFCEGADRLCLESLILILVLLFLLLTRRPALTL